MTMAAESSVVMNNRNQPFVIYKQQKYQYNINNCDYVQNPQKDFIKHTLSYVCNIYAGTPYHPTGLNKLRVCI